MTERMHDLLDRLAQGAPSPRVDPGMFQRARRARRREAALLTAGTLGLVVLIIAGVSAVGSGVLRSDRSEVAQGPTTPAMPSVIYPVPEHVSGPRERDLAIGPVAAAFYDRHYEPVLVSAVDGSYHRMNLPGPTFPAENLEGNSLALSHDGTKLAFSWRGPLPESSGPHVPSGIAVADLETGEVKRFARPGGRGVRVENIRWSPNDRYLGYWVLVRRTWDAGSSSSRAFRNERLDLTSGKVTTLPRWVGLTVSGDGRLPVVADRAVGWWDPDRRPHLTRLRLRLTAGSGSDTAAWSPSGDRLALGASDIGRDRMTVLDMAGDRDGDVREVGPRGHLEVSGWLDDSRVVALHIGPDAQTSTLRIVNVDRHTSRTAVRVEDHWSSGYSFASDLLARPTREFPQPDWPVDWLSVARRVATVAGILAVGLTLLWRYRRARGPSSDVVGTAGRSGEEPSGAQRSDS